MTELNIGRTSSIAPDPHPVNLTGAFGETVEVSRSDGRVVVEIAEGMDLISAHLTVDQAWELASAIRRQAGLVALEVVA